MKILDGLHTERLAYESEYVPLADAANLLAAYEETGMDPEAIERMVDAYGRGLTLREDAAERLQLIREIPTARLRELVESDRDGRCVVLPCKVGETVYIANWFGVTRHIVCRIIDPYFYTDDARGFGLHDFGKTVFLTPNDAKATLASAERRCADGQSLQEGQ